MDERGTEGPGTATGDGAVPSRRDAQRAERAAAARHRQRVLLSVLVGILVVGAVFYVMWTRGADMFSADEQPTLVATTQAPVEDFPGPGGEPVQVTVAADVTPEVLGASLVDAGVVSSVEVFVAAYGQNPDATTIAPGTYNVFRQMRAADAITALLDPENLADLTVEVTAGLTVPEIKTELARITGVSVAQLDEAFADVAGTGLPAEAGGIYEGWIAPGTYHFTLGTTPVEMIRAMIASTVSTLDAAGVAPEDRLAVLTLGSLVEEEQVLPEDQAAVAGVFSNRVESETVLQRDSTVRYALGLADDAPVTQEDRETDLPYNTYLHVGLPPSPISTVSPEALQAAVAPAETTARYFVVVDPVAKVVQFSDTYTEYQDSLKALQAWRDANA